MNDEQPDDDEAIKVLTAQVIALQARCDALFACVSILSIQAGNSPDLVNSLMKGVSDLQTQRNLTKVEDIDPALAASLLRLVQGLSKPGPNSDSLPES